MPVAVMSFRFLNEAGARYVQGGGQARLGGRGVGGSEIGSDKDFNRGVCGICDEKNEGKVIGLARAIRKFLFLSC
ncbi:MAG: hypothetical protein AB8U48_04200 [Anaplasma ovis]